MSDSEQNLEKDDEQLAALELDACGLFCPEPVMLLHNKIRDIEAGQILRLVATDPSTGRDVPKFCQFLGHDLLESTTENDRFVYMIKKNSNE